MMKQKNFGDVLFKAEYEELSVFADQAFKSFMRS